MLYINEGCDVIIVAAYCWLLTGMWLMFFIFMSLSLVHFKGHYM